MNSQRKASQIAIDKLWGSLRRRHQGCRYGPVPYDKKAFAVWVMEQSVEGKGEIWRCPDTGALMRPMTQRPMRDVMTVDHRVPLSRGGTSHFSNLAIISKEANLIKGAMSYGYYGRLMSFLSTWPENERNDVLKRLKGYRPGWQK